MGFRLLGLEANAVWLNAKPPSRSFEDPDHGVHGVMAFFLIHWLRASGLQASGKDFRLRELRPEALRPEA
jgi:hypothetical protein